jgi:hypothetical protein
MRAIYQLLGREQLHYAPSKECCNFERFGVSGIILNGEF